MTTAAATLPDRRGASPALRAQSVASAWASSANLLMAGALALAFVALFFRWFLFQNKHSWGSEDWSHAYVVPLIAGYAVWRQRVELARLSPTVFWPGLLPLVFGVVCYFSFVIFIRNHMLQGFAMILALAGLCLMMTGPRVFGRLAFPLAYLVFGVTIAEIVMLRVTYQLQIWATAGAQVFMSLLGPLFGFVTERAGNTLTVTTRAGESIPLNVAEACSGMRMVVAFFALGAAVAMLSCRQWWQRIALLLLAGPIAMFVNILRVTCLGVVSIYNPELSRGEAHMMIGVLWLVPAFFLFMGVVWALKKIAPDSAPTPAPAPGKAAPKGAQRA